MSDEKRPKVTVAPRSQETSFSVEEILARRLASDPFAQRQAEIPLKDAGKWKLYEANSYANENEHYEMVYKKGWQPLTLADLAPGITPESLGYRTLEDGQTLCRGERGQERLYKMPQAAYDQLAQAKAAVNKKGQGSPSAMKDDLANATAAKHGSEAGDFVHNLRVTGEDREVAR